MTARHLSSIAALATLMLSSCYVIPDPAPAQPKVSAETVTTAEQQKIEEQRRRKRQQAAAEKKLQEESTGTTSDPGGTGATTPPPIENRASIPVAQPVPGKEGFVFSPFNNKVIDVRDMPSGTKVADPTYPASEKKHFRVP